LKNIVIMLSLGAFLLINAALLPVMAEAQPPGLKAEKRDGTEKTLRAGIRWVSRNGMSGAAMSGRVENILQTPPENKA
jgi:hypothetical protein